MTQTGPADGEARTAEDFAARIADVTARIAEAATSAGRRPEEVRLLPVTKTVPEERLRAAIAGGVRELGENVVQEARRKAEALSDIPSLRWSIIGHLQTNKAKYVARFADEFQALDSLAVAETLQRRLDAEDRTLDVFVQVNTSREESKSGVRPESAADLLRGLSPFDRLRPVGLMTIAIPGPDERAVRACFSELRALRDRIRDEGIAGAEGLSMGMSGDYALAVEEGSTVVRVGRGIFGARPPRPA